MNSCRSGHLRVGIISDTHGLFRPEITTHFSGVSHIFHAGDIGKPSILQQLEALAPTTAVLGNIDIPSWFPALHQSEIITVHATTFMIIHNIDMLDLDPAAAGIDVVIFGHSHTPESFERNGVRYINPGSAGPPRFRTHPSIALLSFDGSFNLTPIAL